MSGFVREGGGEDKRVMCASRDGSKLCLTPLDARMTVLSTRGSYLHRGVTGDGGDWEVSGGTNRGGGSIHTRVYQHSTKQ